MKYLLIYNPNSGTKRDNERLLQGVKELIEKEGHTAELRETKAEGHATRIAREAVKSDVDVIVAVGGDGTVNEIGHALTGSDKVLGIIPNGSGNGLARELRIPMNAKAATSTLLRHHVTTIDTCEANGECFFVTCGIGLDGMISEEFADSDTRGPATYVKETVSLLLNYKPSDYLITIDGREVTATAYLVAVANASQYGNNAFIAPNASMSDGMLDVTIMKPFSEIDAAKIALQLFTKEIDKSDYTSMYRGRDIVITSSQPVPYHIDGEPKKAVSRLEVKVHSKKLRVIAGSDEDRDKNIVELFQSIIGAR
ncbi:MAG: diacylglycerol kinase family lipid kinase [Porphyromonas sp.]|nr:diacylglycerol kinase family lipid kinase [Porphyromonas sp.]